MCEILLQLNCPQCPSSKILKTERKRTGFRTCCADAVANSSCQATARKEQPRRSGKVITLQALKQVEGQLPISEFIRTHKSYLINISKIDTLERNRISIGKAIMPVGETYYVNFCKTLKLP
jgi:hypothetical protein